MTRRQAMVWMAGAAALPLGCRQVLDSRPTIRLANWGGAGDDSEYFHLVQDVYRGFEREHDVRLRVEGTPNTQDYVSKLLLDYVSGSMPDVITLDASSAAAFINNGSLLDLAPLILRDQFDLDDFYPNVVDIASRSAQGQEPASGSQTSERMRAVYAIPTDFTPMVMYCNTKLFRESGVEVPAGHWTFEEFLQKALALSKGYQFGFEFANWMPGWVMFLWNSGADVLSSDGSKSTGFIDSQQSIDAVQFLADLVLKHKAAPDLSQAAATGVDYFATGRAAMKVSGHWYLVSLQAAKDIDMADVAVVELPTNQPQSVTVMYEAGNAIGAKCRHPELAWEYLKYFSSQRIQLKYNSGGIAVCARKDVEGAKLDQSREAEPGGDNKARLARSFQSIVPSARAPWGASVEGYDRVEDIGQKAMDAVLKNGVSVQTALSKAAIEIDEEFSKR